MQLQVQNNEDGVFINKSLPGDVFAFSCIHVCIVMKLYFTFLCRDDFSHKLILIAAMMRLDDKLKLISLSYTYTLAYNVQDWIWHLV